MLNFELYNPVNYVFGKGQIEKLADLLPSNTKILVAYGGGSIFKNGVYEQVKKALPNHDIVEFGGIEPNPRFETLMKAVDIIRTEKIGFILAVGGGSVIDGVKFISAAVHFEGDAADILKKRILFKDVTKVIPFGTVLTLPATGSEMNSGAVVTIEATQEKLTLGGSALFPVFSIVDPTVITSLPKRQLQNGVVDAFTHVMEQYLTYKHDAVLQDRISESILQTLIEIGPDVVENPSDYKLASNFVWSATMALNGLIQKGVPSDWATHMIGHELTALYEIVPMDNPDFRDVPTFTIDFRYKEPTSDVSTPLELLIFDEGYSFAEASDFMKWTASTAAFSMLLMESNYKGTCSYEKVSEWLNSTNLVDEHGFKNEFKSIVNMAKNL